jgi:hypothetical protein
MQGHKGLLARRASQVQPVLLGLKVSRAKMARSALKVSREQGSILSAVCLIQPIYPVLARSVTHI